MNRPVTEADLEKIRLETTGTLELVQFVRPAELDPLLLDTPYYVGPDGPAASESFGVVREALQRAKLRIGPSSTEEFVPREVAITVVQYFFLIYAMANVGVAFVLHGMQHPMHLHGQRFLVLAVNGTPNDNLAWKDTVVVPAGATVDLLVDLSNPGRWMLHCHIAEHLAGGMMTAITVD